VLRRLARELDRLDADQKMDRAVRARTVARVCAVALAAHKQLAEPDGDDERGTFDGYEQRYDLAQLSAHQLKQLQSLLTTASRSSA
jgi:hypothetical protein